MAILRIVALEECLQTLMPENKSSKKKEIGRSSNGSGTEEREVLPYFFVPSSNLSETIETEAGVTAETTAQEFIEGQQSNVYNRLHSNYEFWKRIFKVQVLF